MDSMDLIDRMTGMDGSAGMNGLAGMDGLAGRSLRRGGVAWEPLAIPDRAAAARPMILPRLR